MQGGRFTEALYLREGGLVIARGDMGTHHCTMGAERGWLAHYPAACGVECLVPGPAHRGRNGHRVHQPTARGRSGDSKRIARQ
jgi:hypothetical protein